MRIAQWVTAIMLFLFLTVARAGDNPLLGTWILKSFDMAGNVDLKLRMEAMQRKLDDIAKQINKREGST